MLESKDGVPLMFVCYYIRSVYVLYTVSSPYLLVFGDDRVRNTQEQMMLQVNLVRHKARVWAIWKKRFIRVLSFIVFK